MPLDTFARDCHHDLRQSRPDAHPRPEQSGQDDGDKEAGSSSSSATAPTMFPNGRPRKFTAARVALHWLSEAAAMEAHALLVAGDRQMREALALFLL